MEIIYLKNIYRIFEPERDTAMTTIERLYKTAQILPEPAIAELLDFAEFLREKTIHRHTNSNEVLLVDLIGGLENSATFAGDPLEIQKQLRDEWN